MSGAGIQIDGESDALSSLSAIVGRLDHAEPMWAAIGAYGVTSTQRRFELGVGPGFDVWPPSLRALATGGKTLVLSARLMQSQTFNASNSGVEWGTNVIYAAIHQLGGVIDIPARETQVHFKRHKRTGKRLKGFRKEAKADESIDVTIPAHKVTMPARPFLGIDDDDEHEIVAIAQDFVGGEEARP